jgi:hypothetical protein
MAAFWPTLATRFELEIGARMGLKRLDVVVEVKCGSVRERREPQDAVRVDIGDLRHLDAEPMRYVRIASDSSGHRCQISPIREQKFKRLEFLRRSRIG